MTVLYDQKSRSYRINWHSDYATITDDKQKTLDADYIFNLVEKSITNIQEIIRGDYSITKRSMDIKLRSRGKNLWAAIIPDEIKSHYLENPNRYTAVRIVSERNPVPWELLIPHDIKTEKDLGFWSEHTRICRWKSGKRPSAAFEIESAALLLPSDPPARAEEEINLIGHYLKSEGVKVSVSRSLDDFYGIMEQANVNLIHMACHNAYICENGQIKMTFDNSPLFPDDLIEFEGRFADKPLFVFLNACRSNGQESSMMELDGWAGKFVKCGAELFMGTLWKVRDETAAKFAAKFYQKLASEGLPLYECLSRARMKARNMGADPTWLAYSVFGNMNAKLTFPRTRRE